MVSRKVLAMMAALPSGAIAQDISGFARDVTTHVLIHELGHAVFRELDVPVLGNEEAQADTFASIFITQMMYDDAARILTARAKSWLYEDSQVTRESYDFRTEHPLDIRRAYQTLCILYGADPAEFADDVAFAGIPQDDLDDCSDSVPDQIEGWAKVIEPVFGTGWRPLEVVYGEGPMTAAMQESGLLEGIAETAGKFAWPSSGIYIHFDHCDYGASWSRSERRILLCDDYVARFVRQGEAIEGK